MYRRLVDYLLYSVDITGEGRNYNTLPLCGIEKVLEAFANGTLGLCVAGALGIGALAHERKYSAVAKLAETRQVDDSALDGGIIHLEVSGVHDNSCRSVDSERTGVRNGVINANELHGHAAHADILPRLHNVERSLGEQSVLLELALHKS